MYLYFCETCNKLISKKDNSELSLCANCQQPMIPLNKTVEEWNGLTSDEMKEVVEMACEEKKQKPEIKKPSIKKPSLNSLQSSSRTDADTISKPGQAQNSIIHGIDASNNKPQEAKQSGKSSNGSTWSAAVVIAIIFYIISGIMLYKGIDKMTNYNSSSYHSENAYVGGDAYNFIINGTYATSFFVLSMGFLMTGTICIAIDSIKGSIASSISSNKPQKDKFEDEEYFMIDGNNTCFQQI